MRFRAGEGSGQTRLSGLPVSIQEPLAPDSRNMWVVSRPVRRPTAAGSSAERKRQWGRSQPAHWTTAASNRAVGEKAVVGRFWGRSDLGVAIGPNRGCLPRLRGRESARDIQLVRWTSHPELDAPAIGDERTGNWSPLASTARLARAASRHLLRVTGELKGSQLTQSRSASAARRKRALAQLGCSVDRRRYPGPIHISGGVQGVAGTYR
jgi:hypothetical protein